MTEYPDYFYKYMPDTEWAIQSLFRCEATFSSRKCFNDLFDSKINYIYPTAHQLKLIRNSLSKEWYKDVNLWFTKGLISAYGKKKINKFIDISDSILDGYLFYCVSSINNSNLMWSHYSNSHYGFCIEFKSKYLTADKVIYRDSIASVDLSHFIKHAFVTIDKEGDVDFLKEENINIGNLISKALLIKLNEWAYESEYRFHLSDDQKKVPLIDCPGKYIIKYQPEWVESIIFGCRANIELIKKIKNGLSKIMIDVKYRKATEDVSSIKIVG